ncbi:MAG: prepilin-type N-terminal cleavage/methylation domain-containing protein [Candidatus Paceibacterota bacterium]
MKKICKKISSGFTLIETLVAISIFTVSIILLMSVLGNGISDINNVKKKILAGYLAQEGIEYIRNMRDTYVLYSTLGSGKDWDKFKIEFNPCNLGNECGFSTTNPIVISKCTSNPSVCKIYLDNGNYNTTSSGEDSGFTRKIWTDVVGDGELKIYSEVEWIQRSGTQRIVFSENLFNWTEQ